MTAEEAGHEETLILPMGHYVGAQHAAVGADLDCHVLRIGWETYRLDGDAQLAVWALAHGLPEEGEMAPWTQLVLEGAARAAGIPDAMRVLRDLTDRDLLVEVTPGTRQAVEFARACRIRSLLSGIGNTPEEPLLYGIGLVGGQPLLKVPSFTYELWKWGYTCDSLWHVCQIFAQAGRGTDPVHRTQTDPERILGRCLAAVQVLLANGAAYLDEARKKSGNALLVG